MYDVKETAARLPTLADKVACLSTLAPYPDRPRSIKAIETHMSWVFLTEDKVYKLKKPIKRSYLDFSTLAARYRNCKEEVRLNKRLANGVYYGVIALGLEHRGKMRLTPNPEKDNTQPIEWLVLMRRLPTACLLDQALKQDTVTAKDILPVARRLAEFYRQQPAQALSGLNYHQRCAQYIEENRKALTASGHIINNHAINNHSVDTHKVNTLCDQLQHWLHGNARLISGREKHVIEAHGDLRPEHICLTTPPVIIDCLEFNKELRLLDPLDELSYLALACEERQAAFVSNIIIKEYSKTTGDRPPPALLDFYKCYRAIVKAKLAAWHLEDDPEQRRGPWIVQAEHYFQLAFNYLERLSGR